jgi:uncharacterized membrane protein YdjX (TVP38/TMEM64 family)
MKMNIAFLKAPRFWIVVAAAAFIVAFRTTSLGEIASLDTLRAHHGAMLAWVGTNRFFASVVYASTYVVVVAFSIPGATILTLAGGFLFGATFGALLAAVGATVGAATVFLFAQFLFGRGVADRLAARYPSLVDGIRENSWSYLLVLRLVPLFPFALVNLAPAFIGVRLSTYVITTFFGILPGTVIYALFGSGLGSVLEKGGSISLGSIVSPPIMLGLIGLGMLSLAAIPIRKWLHGLNLRQRAVHDPGLLEITHVNREGALR